MSKANSPTKIKRQAIFDLATKIVYRNKGAEYQEKFNPFKDNDRERFKKFYNKTRDFYHRMECEFDHLAAVMGE